MKQNLCIKISYKKYLLANTSFPQPVVLQYTSAVGRACSPSLGLQPKSTPRSEKDTIGRKSLEPEFGIATYLPHYSGTYEMEAGAKPIQTPKPASKPLLQMSLQSLSRLFQHRHGQLLGGCQTQGVAVVA
jgi:hypothetical protein